MDEVTEDLPTQKPSLGPIPLTISRMIDHTLLRTDTNPAEIDKLCAEAKENDFASVCVRPEFVSQAAANLESTPNTVVTTVVGFWEGTYPTEDKVREAKEAVANGASEIDMVINYPLVKQGKYTAAYEDIVAVRKSTPKPLVLKAIVETSQLGEVDVVAATIISCKAGVDFVKTSSGFCGPGARVEDVSLMSVVANLCGDDSCRVKASGGIGSADECLRLIKAGARRIGTSSGVKIAREVEEGEVLEQGSGHAVA